MVKGVVNGVETYYPGRHYNEEVDNSVSTVKKFYTMGSTTVAVRTISGTEDVLNWVLGDHYGAQRSTPESLIGLSPCRYPTWSPDRKQIAFLCEKESDQEGLFILNTEDYAINEVFLGDPANLSQPIWSPDGKRIIYAAGPDYEHRKIYSIRPDGSDRQALTSEEGGYGIIAVYPTP